MTNTQNAALNALIKIATSQLDTGSSYLGMVNCAILHNARRAIIEMAIETPSPKKVVTKKQARRFDMMKFAGKLESRGKKNNWGIKVHGGMGTVCDYGNDVWYTFKTEQATGHYKLASGVLLKTDEKELPPCPDLGTPVAKVTISPDVLEKIALASSKDETRRVLMGVCIGEDAGKFYMVGTDGRRLHLFERPGESVEKWEAIIPSQAIKDLLELHEGEFSMDIYKSHIWTGGDGWAYVSKLIDGVYPNFRQVIPADQGHSVEFNKVEMVENLKKTIIPFCKAQKGAWNKCRIAIGKEEIIFSVEYKGNGVNFALPCKSTKEVIFWCDPYYLIDCLNASPDNSVLWFENDYSPFVLKGGEFKGVVMPLRMS